MSKCFLDKASLNIIFEGGVCPLMTSGAETVWKVPKILIPSFDNRVRCPRYGAGWYLDFEPRRDQTAERKWMRDLNKAYNPWRVYSEDYTCALVPPENWLEVEVCAGEKNYSLKLAH
jgi:uncharacterized protein (DUF1684 family)